MIRAVVNKVYPTCGQSYSLVEIENYKDYYEHLEASLFDVIYVTYKGHRLSVFVDDEGMLKSGNYGRLIADYPNPIFGNVVIVGDVDEEGETLGLPDDLNLTDMFDFSGDIQWRTK